MKILSSSIVLASDVSGAFTVAIAEMSERGVAKKMVDCMVVTGYVGTCIDVVSSSGGVDTITNYLFCADIGAGFYRIDHCANHEFVAA